uniref:Uncharacterized protein n=1 Tax=Megaselia scalaris TaxID=36166 RepID=T1GT59_MEGSC
MLDSMKIPIANIDKKSLIDVARTSLRTKLYPKLADILTDYAAQNNHRHFFIAMVMVHVAHHSDMPKRLESCYILTCNVFLEYEKSKVNSWFLKENSWILDARTEKETLRLNRQDLCKM